jgi:tetratricopeptide (TPR) repeat protein
LALAGVLLVAGLASAVLMRPKADTGKPLREAAGLLERSQFQEALDVLNTQMLGYVRQGAATEEQCGEFYRMRAEAIFLGQAALGISRAENHQRIVENYQHAEETHLELPPADIERLATTLLALDKPHKAAERLEQLMRAADDGGDGESAGEPGQRARRLIRRIVEHNLAVGGEDESRRALTLRLLTTLSQDPQLSLDDRLWSTARQAELRLDEGAAREAVTDLVRAILLVDGQATPAQLAELQLLLGRAYFQEGVDLEKADEAAAIAEEAYAAAPSAEGEAAAVVLRAQINQQLGQIEPAREGFERVRAELSGTAASTAALLGVAETEARLGTHEPALEAYAELVERAKRAADDKAAHAKGDLAPQRICESLMARHAERYLAAAAGGNDAAAAEAYRVALAYAELADSLYAAGEVPAEVLLAMAETHRRLAEGLLDDEAGKRLDHRAIRALDPVTQSEAKHHLMHAGRFYLEYADRVLLTSNQRYLDALWLAADSYDLGGALEDAASAFGRYYDGALESDQRRPEARFRLAQIFQARKEYQVAEPLYKELIENRAGEAGATKGVGRWADASIVPLAQCYLADEDAVNDEQAATLLRSVVDGSVLDPEAIEFREALLELATLEYRTGKYAEAAQLFDEGVNRYPKDERLALMQYRLADSYRLLAADLDKSLREAMPTAERQEREAARRNALTSAKRLFATVRQTLGARGEEVDESTPPLTALEKLHLRNAAFYIGDCAFDLGDYEEAIRAYGEAAEQYARDPSSLVAKVQIVNAYVALQQWDNARTAQERARQHYENLTRQFGEQVWDDPTLPMEQKHWERWLSSGRRLESPQASAAGG